MCSIVRTVFFLKYQFLVKKENCNTGVLVKHWQRDQRLFVKKHISNSIMFKINESGGRTFLKCICSVESYIYKSINEVERLVLELLNCPHWFLKGVIILEKIHFSFCSCALPTLRVGRSATRLTVYWAFLS